MSLLSLSVIVSADVSLCVIKKFVNARLKYWSMFVRQRWYTESVRRFRAVTIVEAFQLPSAPQTAIVWTYSYYFRLLDNIFGNKYFTYTRFFETIWLTKMNRQQNIKFSFCRFVVLVANRNRFHLTRRRYRVQFPGCDSICLNNFQ